jgi:hypothetical protein
MRRQFKPGDHVTRNSEAGRVGGTILKVHTREVDKGAALRRLCRR